MTEALRAPDRSFNIRRAVCPLSVPAEKASGHTHLPCSDRTPLELLVGNMYLRGRQTWFKAQFCLSPGPGPHNSHTLPGSLSFLLEKGQQSTASILGQQEGHPRVSRERPHLEHEARNTSEECGLCCLGRC